MEDIEFFLSDDLIQGEEAPFFILWRGLSPARIDLEWSGFTELIELYNAREDDIVFAKEENRASIMNVLTPGYLGGVLKTPRDPNPFFPGELSVTLAFDGVMPRSLSEKRVIYSTKIEVPDIPDSLALVDDSLSSSVKVTLKGSTTVTLFVDELDGNEIPLDIPSDVRAAMDKFVSALVEGMKRLKEMFPEYGNLIDLCMTPPDKSYISNYVERLVEAFEEVEEDERFMESMATAIMSAILGQESVRDKILNPLMEYLESTVAEKAFFAVPFLQAQIPEGGGNLRLSLTARNLLNEECGKPIEIHVPIEASSAANVLIRNLFRVRRISWE